MFKYLEDRDLEIIVGAFQLKQFQENDMVITQGDDGDELFLVSTGYLNCYKVFGNDTQPTDLKKYKTGEVFGELTLLYNAPRAASIQALEPSALYSLDRETFNHIVKESAIKHRQKYEAFLNKVEILQELDSYERGKLCDCLEILNFVSGDAIIKEGQNGDSFYLILEGTAKALKRNPHTGEQVNVKDYVENEYFGELALMRDEPRAATIEATSDIKVARIDRNAFKRILGPIDEILKRNAEQYKKFVK